MNETPNVPQEENQDTCVTPEAPATQEAPATPETPACETPVVNREAPQAAPAAPLYTAAPATPALHTDPGQGFAIAALVCGILSIICCCFSPLGGMVPCILGIVFACVARSKSGKFNGMSLAALICAIVGAVVGMISFMVNLIILLSDPTFMETFFG